MTNYIGNKRSTSGLVESIEQIATRFDARRHAMVKLEVQAFLSLSRRYLTAAAAVTSAEKKEAAARSALADADAERDSVIDRIDRALIGAGADKKNSFKQFNLPSPALVKRAALEKEEQFTATLIKAIGATLPKEASALSAANAKVAARQIARDAAVKAAITARAQRDALDRPTRAALSVLKLQVKTAEKLGLADAYREFFASDAP